ncbi:MAG: riboflavin synthase [Desulfovibrio sp.]|jgi:riboflavin synthase|nr:riboflavin synthase [Desulfovibrio sp.]
MFTGIIQGQGEVVSLRKSGAESRLTICPLYVLENLSDGESIAVNGVCLSVEEHGSDSFTVYASAHTLSQTTFSALKVGALVNMERALALGERLGGHLVSGHVDCTASVLEMRAAGQSRIYRFAFPVAFAPEVIPKGSVALDGISLTVTVCGENYLEVNIIPDTQKHTTACGWRVGALVNMETDMIGKYVRRLMETGVAGVEKSVGVSKDLLLRNGFI